MRTLNRVLLTGSAATLAFGAWSGSARAQFDIDPPLPNVLLLVDTSGTMEYLIKPDATTGANILPGGVAGSECDPTKPAATQQNRWTSLVSVLTGSINGFSCQATPRNTPAFKAEYGLGITPPANASWLAPYDWSYYLPFNRMYSNGCTPGPGVQSSNWWDWPAGSIRYHDALGAACAQPWSQQPDGLLDTFRGRVRFGMMTFDTLPDQTTGVVSNSPDLPGGMKGMWSYYKSWNPASGTYAQGYPPNCASTAFEVGARNPAAPPWEGRLIPFGAWDATLGELQQTNDHIQESLIAMRPYGATPIAGMFDDARNFFTADGDTDQNTGKPFGPKDDPYSLGGCRKQYVIFLTDGANGPDYDLRPSCNQAGGVCPYPPAADTALALSSQPGNSSIETFVVGFAVSNPAALATVNPPITSCSQLDQTNVSLCANPPAALVPCCNLSKLAIAGGTQHAYFADDPVALQQVLSDILGSITSSSTARTIPVFSSVSSTAAQGTNAQAAGYRFVAQFSADASGHLWRGQLKRERFTCTSNVASPQAPAATSGDDFGENVDYDDPLHPRQFWSYVAPKLGTKVVSDGTIRPGIVSDDGMGTYAQGAPGMLPADAPTFISTMSSTSEALAINASAPPAACTTAFSTTTGSVCVDKLLQWEVGTSAWPKTRNKAQCKANGGLCSKLGSVYHSTPAISTAPHELLRDDSYDAFAQQQVKRPLVLYTATTDGQLHAFKISASDPSDPFKIDQLSNNELWSFFPPTVLPSLLGSYDRQAVLLDGAPVIADIAGQVVSTTLPPVYERRRQFPVKWSTVLLAGGGAAGGFYYALDITNPSAPRFLWQLSKDASGNPLFGDTTSTPTIATVALADSGTDVKEVAVAILPGGTSSSVAPPCLPTTYTTATNPITNNPLSLMSDPTYHERGQVRCWKAGAGRSLTVVRLDNGEVLMNFRASAAEGPPNLLAQNPARAQVVPMASPISGVAVAYPGQTGQVATRAYVGDADGVLWRVDLSGTDPTKWTMSIAWDSYSVFSDTAQMGQVIQTAPVISTNPLGDTVILFSTGDQEQLTASTMNNRVWSIQEKRNAIANSFQTKANWYFDFTGGERVTGPMGIFDSVAYFSTFSPNPSGSPVCAFGVSKIWGLDYQTAAPRFPNGASPPKQYDTADNTIIAGVAVTKTPSCDTTTTTTDAYLGSHSYVTSADAGVYQLVWQKGPGAGITSNSAVKTDTFTGIQSMNLKAPRQSTRIDSWATIIE
jgi:type IV pilus assembly protein PilY1